MRLTNRWEELMRPETGNEANKQREELMRPETGNEANKQMGGADETRDWE